MDADRIRALAEGELATYMARRLRLEEPLDPPLDNRWGPEAPEEIFIAAWQDGDRDFSDRLDSAILLNLERLRGHEAVLLQDWRARHHLASLAFLARQTECRALAASLKRFGRHLWSQIRAATPARLAPIPENDPRAALRRPFFHIVDALIDLSEDPDLFSFWEEILEWSPDPGIRAASYFAVSKWRPSWVVEHLDRIIGDRQIVLSNVAFNLVHHYPGVEEIRRTMRHLPDELREKFLLALADAETDESFVRLLRGPSKSALERKHGLRPMRRALSQPSVFEMEAA